MRGEKVSLMLHVSSIFRYSQLSYQVHPAFPHTLHHIPALRLLA